MRATSVAAAAPNRRIIGGAGTGVPPVDEDELPPEEEALDDEAEELDALEALELELDPELPLDVLPEEPKLDEPPVAPELVELLLEPLLAEDDADEEALLADEALLPDDALLPELPDEPDEPLLPWLELPWLELP